MEPLSPFYHQQKGSILLKVGIFWRSQCLGRSWRRYSCIKRRTRCRTELWVATRKWNRLSVSTAGLVDTGLEIANRSADILQVIVNSLLHPLKICRHL